VIETTVTPAPPALGIVILGAYRYSTPPARVEEERIWVLVLVKGNHFWCSLRRGVITDYHESPSRTLAFLDSPQAAQRYIGGNKQHGPHHVYTAHELQELSNRGISVEQHIFDIWSRLP
jgi:hypothetical protein